MTKTETHTIRATENVTAQRSPRIIIAAGGTGGHVYPAIAIADAICEQHPEAEVRFVGTKDRMEWEAVPKAGYEIESVWISGFHRRLTLQNLLFPVKLAVSVAQSFGILSRFKPQVVVSCGGFAAGPIGWTAARRGIPVVVQEQNSFPGVTNRMLGKNAAKVFTAFEEAEQYFPDGRTELAGNPTRKTLKETDRNKAFDSFGLDPEKKTLLVLGGSGGARSINEAMAANIEELHDEMGLQVIWQCGKRYYDELKKCVQPERFEGLRLTDYLHNMDEAYAVADLVVSRAGASSCSELELTGKPSILIPSPNVAGNHQVKNARSMADHGAARILYDEEAEAGLPKTVRECIYDKETLEAMRQSALALAKPDAADHIAREILKLSKAQLN